MLSLWNEEEAAACAGDLELRVYTSRLLGREPSLVLHGGGNTSVKLELETILGEREDVLLVKGSGWDLATIEAAGFSPVRMRSLLGLARLERLTDEQMAAELRAAQTDATAPAPSVEAILHAVLPHRFVDHTHADAVVTLTNTPSGLERARALYPDALLVPYVMPGFDLARAASRIYEEQANGETVGLILMNHGVFTFGDTARVAYERMIDLVTRAEECLREKGAWTLPEPSPRPRAQARREAVAELRRAVADCAGFPVVLHVSSDPGALAFAQRPDVAEISQQGPATPDHVLRTKRLPLVGRDVTAYAEAYGSYFAEHAPRTDRELAMLDPAPRVVLDPELGLCTVGRSAAEARIVEDVYRQTIGIILRATALERYQALPAGDLFDVEYWDLEQAKLRRAGAPPPLAGEVAVVTGAASGIGKACVAALLRRGAAVAGLDRDPAVESAAAAGGYLGVRCDVTEPAEVAAALDAAVHEFGGLDILVLNAGIFPAGTRIDALELEQWRRVMQVNLDANLILLREAAPLLRRAPRYGRVVVVGSKNVPAPGPGAAAYSASKAALTQLARVAALEWGSDGIRVNVVHPNAVYDTAIWTEEVLADRAASYGLSVDEYRRNNVLRTDVTSGDVAELVVELCGPAFARTTGAQIPVDGGNERVI